MLAIQFGPSRRAHGGTHLTSPFFNLSISTWIPSAVGPCQPGWPYEAIAPAGRAWWDVELVRTFVEVARVAELHVGGGLEVVEYVCSLCCCVRRRQSVTD